MWTASPVFRLKTPSDLQDRELISAGLSLVQSIVKEFPDETGGLAHLARLRTGGRFMDEWRATAELVGTDWKTVALANISYDCAIIAIGCSTMALATPAGPVLARNLDWWPEEPLARASLGMWTDKLFAATWPGFSGVVTGMSKRGFAVALNAIELPEKALPLGYPVLLMLRRVLEDAENFEEAVQLLSKTRLLASCLLTVVGTENSERVCIERSPTRAALRRPRGDEPLITTNDFRLLEETKTSSSAEIYETTCARFDALTLLAGHLDGYSDEHLLEALTDQDVVQGITVQHTILRPSTLEAGVWVPSRHLR